MFYFKQLKQFQIGSRTQDTVFINVLLSYTREICLTLLTQMYEYIP